MTAPFEMGEVVVTAPEEGTAASGYRYRDAAVGPLGELPLRDTPFSINVVAGELIENRNAHTPADALKTVPTVMPLMSAAGYSSMHRVMIRGFNASDQSELRDGLVDRSFTLPQVEDVDRIEVFNGVSGFLYGFSAVGGSVNSVSKPPLDTPFASLAAGFYNKAIFFGHADMGGPVIGDAVTYRLNLYGEQGDTYIDGGDQSRQLVSGAVRWRMFEGTNLTFRGYYQHLNNWGLPTYFDIKGINYKLPLPFKPTAQYGQHWTYNEASKTVLDLALDSRLNEVFSLRAACRWGTMWRKYRFVGAKLTDPAGAYDETFVDSSGNDEITTAAYALLDAKFDTWKFHHQLTMGYTHWGFTFDRGTNVVANLGPSHIERPERYHNVGRAKGYDRSMKTQNHNLLIGDRIEFCPAFSVLGGVNYSLLDSRFAGAYMQPGSQSRTTQEALTPTLGAVLKPVPELSVYGSYMEGLEQGGTAPASAANALQVLAPTVSSQYEVGVKTTLWERFDINLALFRIDKVNQYLDSRDNIYKQDGRERHQGLELTVGGKLLPGLTVTGGLTAFTAKVTDAPANPKTEGEIPVNIAERQARLYVEYELPKIPWVPGVLTLTGGANYNGARPVNIPNSTYIPAVTTFDLGARYQPFPRLTVNFNVSNLLDKHYWSYYRSGSDGAGEDGLLLGDPRLFSAAVKYTF